MLPAPALPGIPTKFPASCVALQGATVVEEAPPAIASAAKQAAAKSKYGRETTTAAL